MAKALSSKAQSYLDRKSITRSYNIYINDVINKDVISYSQDFSAEFGIAAFSVELNNDAGIYSKGGSKEIKLGDTVKLKERFYATGSDEFTNFIGYVRQREISHSKGVNSITLTCLDLLCKLEETDIGHKFEATKIQVTDEILTPTYLPAPNDNMATIFNFAHEALASDPPITVVIKDLRTNLEYLQESGFEINYETGQLILGSALNAKYNYNVICKAYSFYPIGLTIEDILEDIITTQDGYCYSGDTEVLTENGWMCLKDIVEKKIKIKIATLNSKKNIVEYHYPKKYIRSKFKGNLIEVFGKRINFLVTPNHKVWVRNGNRMKNKKESFAFLKATKISKYSEYRKDFPYIGKEKKYFILPEYSVTSIRKKFVTDSGFITSASKRIIKLKARKIVMDKWLRFFGIWLAEGYLCRFRKGKIKAYGKVYISQNKGKKSKIINSWLEDLGFKNRYKERNDRPGQGKFLLWDVQLGNYLKQFGKSKEKFIPKEFKNLSKRQLNILLEAMMLGDGTDRGRKGSTRVYVTSSKKLANDFFEIALKVGYCPTMGKTKTYYIDLAKIPNTMSKKGKIVKKSYDGFVYCIDVSNHLMYIRRKGKCCWNGNSNYLFNETSAIDVVTNHLTETFLNIEGKSIDTLLPNYSTQTKTIRTNLIVTCSAGATSISVADTTGFPIAGTGDVNGDVFTWTNKTATTLTGIPSTGSDALKAHPVGAYVQYDYSLVAGRCWYTTYSNITTTLTSSNFTIPVGRTIDYIDLHNGFIILDAATSILNTLTCNINYSFLTLQATGIEINKIEFTEEKTENRLEAVKALRQFLAPNYLIQTIGTDKIWARYVKQKTAEDYTLQLKTKLSYAEDTDIYTHTKFFGKSANPKNVCLNEDTTINATDQTYNVTVNDQEITYDSDEGDYRVYKTGLSAGKIVTDNVTPVVRLNGVPIDNKPHEILMQQVYVQITTKTEYEQSSGK